MEQSLFGKQFQVLTRQYADGDWVKSYRIADGYNPPLHIVKVLQRRGVEVPKQQCVVLSGFFSVLDCFVGGPFVEVEQAEEEGFFKFNNETPNL